MRKYYVVSNHPLSIEAIFPTVRVAVVLPATSLVTILCQSRLFSPPVQAPVSNGTGPVTILCQSRLFSPLFTPVVAQYFPGDK